MWPSSTLSRYWVATRWPASSKKIGTIGAPPATNARVIITSGTVS